MMPVLIGVAVALAAAWAVLVVVLLVVRPDGTTLRDAARILPDMVRLVRALSRDTTVPRRSRVAIRLVAVYLLLPFDLIPDFIPVVGYADDAILVVVALRLVMRSAGVDAIERNWTGSPAGLAVVRRLAG